MSLKYLKIAQHISPTPTGYKWMVLYPCSQVHNGSYIFRKGTLKGRMLNYFVAITETTFITSLIVLPKQIHRQGFVTSGLVIEIRMVQRKAGCKNNQKAHCRLIGPEGTFSVEGEIYEEDVALVESTWMGSEQLISMAP